MKLIFFSVIGLLSLAWILWRASLPRVWRWLGARPAAQLPVWRQVKERLDLLAHRARLPAPELWILSEFSPNALCLRGPRAGLQLGLTEGLLRSLEPAELDAVLSLCLSHGSSRRRVWQTFLALQLFPFACLLQSYPLAVQVVLSPWLTACVRVFNPPSSVLKADRRAEGGEALAAGSALQKMAVLGRKIPLRRWNFALDSLFLLSPLALDGNPFWVFLSQPSVEERRRNLLTPS